MARWLFLLTQLLNRLWLTVALYSALGLAAALAAAKLDRFVPEDFPLKLGSDSVGDILAIIASSMLAVATFSLSALVNAYTSVAANASPRAAELLVSDIGIRRSLATFVGAFMYAIVGIVAVHTGYYGAQGRVILFFVTLGVLLLVTLAMLRWIGDLSRLAQIGPVVERVSEVTWKALQARPIVLARVSSASPDAAAGRYLRANEVGFVQNVDMDALQAAAERHGVHVHLTALPGAFVHAGVPLLWTDGPPLDGDLAKALRIAVTIGSRRTFEQDPRYGLVVLGEIAARALSPGVNDPGAAREVMAIAAGLLSRWAAAEVDSTPCHDVSVVHLPLGDLLRDVLEPVARHGAGNPVVHRELQSALLAVAEAGDQELADAARALSRVALDLASQELRRPDDLAEAAAAAEPVLRQRAW